MIEIDTEQMYTVENTGEFNQNNVNQRLDIWLSNQIPDLSRSPVFTDIFFEVQVSSLTLTLPCDMRV